MKIRTFFKRNINSVFFPYLTLTDPSMFLYTGEMNNTHNLLTDLFSFVLYLYKVHTYNRSLLKLEEIMKRLTSLSFSLIKIIFKNLINILNYNLQYYRGPFKFNFFIIFITHTYTYIHMHTQFYSYMYFYSHH